MGWNGYVSISSSAGKVSWIIIIIIFCEIIFITLLRNCVDKAAVHGRLRPRHPCMMDLSSLGARTRRNQYDAAGVLACARRHYG